MARLLVVDPLTPDPGAMTEAAAAIRAGQLVAFPTETVYGLGANALDVTAVQRLFAAKGRPPEDPVIVHVLGVGDLGALVAALPPWAHTLAESFWPGPLTIVLPRAAVVPDAVTAGLDSVAVRAPSHPVARALLALAGVPIAAPSANRFGHTSPTTARHVLDDLGDAVDLVLDGGPTPVGVESTVLDARAHPPRLLRPGGVTLEALRRIEPGLVVAASSSPALAGPQRSPGQLARHYAPRARLVLLQGPAVAVPPALSAAARTLVDGGRTVGLLVAEEDLPGLSAVAGEVEIVVLGPLGADDEVARRLFAALRTVDEAGVDVILARDWGAAGLALAIRDRLARAAEGLVVALTGDAAEDAASISGPVIGANRPPSRQV